jgi:hypothetical protein
VAGRRYLKIDSSTYLALRIFEVVTLNEFHIVLLTVCAICSSTRSFTILFRVKMIRIRIATVVDERAAFGGASFIEVPTLDRRFPLGAYRAGEHRLLAGQL